VGDEGWSGDQPTCASIFSIRPQALRRFSGKSRSGKISLTSSRLVYTQMSSHCA